MIEKYGLSKTSDIKTIVNKTPDVPGERLMDSLLSRYRGKAVVIDFWATWCRPCIAGIKKMEPLKTELQNQGVVFVYITDTSSGKKEWEERIREIGGEHYYLTKEEWETLSSSKEYGFKGIPAYLLFDSKGVLKNKITGFPGVEEMKQMIEKM